jgi:hypothetical protein
MALSGSYLDRDEFATYTVAPSELVAGDFIDPSGTWDAPHAAKRTAWRAFLDAQLVAASSFINSQLGKRYAVAFDTPAPAVLKLWLATLVTPWVYWKRGVDPSDAQMVALEAEATKAREDIAKAADAVEGLFDLPLRQDTTTTGIAKGAPLAYTEWSPYTHLDIQAGKVCP